MVNIVKATLRNGTVSHGVTVTGVLSGARSADEPGPRSTGASTASSVAPGSVSVRLKTVVLTAAGECSLPTYASGWAPLYGRGSVSGLTGPGITVMPTMSHHVM